jgi:hypothetical protein
MRTGNRGSGASIERQKLRIAEWLIQNDLAADEEWEVYSNGSQLRVGLEGCLEVAAGGEKIISVTEDATRISRNFRTSRALSTRAAEAGLELRFCLPSPMSMLVKRAAPENRKMTPSKS